MTPTGEISYLTVLVRVDVERIAALRHRFATRFLRRCFTAGERRVCLRRARPDAGLAARLAARMALAAGARRLGIAPTLRPEDAEVVTDARGRPALIVRGPIARHAPRLSLAHDGGVAVAALLLTADTTPTR